MGTGARTAGSNPPEPMLWACSVGHGTEVPAHDLPEGRSTCATGVEVDQQEREPAGHPRHDSWSEANQEDRRPPASRPTDQGDECTAEAGKADEWAPAVCLWSCPRAQQISTSGPRITQQPAQGFGIQRSTTCSWLEVITSDRRTRSFEGTSRHHPKTDGAPHRRQSQKGI